MAVLRELNLLGQQRLDIPQLRSIESAVRGDFDLLAGTIFSGKQPLVVRGFELSSTVAGTQASGIQVVVANSILVNFNATESGSMYSVPSNRANETLSSLNSKVSGSFTASATNYVGVDVRRLADATTSDIIQFLNATTLLETSRTVPLARTLDYRFTISTTDFSTQPNIVPIAIVTTDASINIVSIVDARQMAFRMAPGGSFASSEGGYSWPTGRSEDLTSLDMVSGDKSITSQYDWMKAAMTRIQEIGGGEFWYSATADRNVTMIWVGTTFSNGENFEWVGSANLHWKGVRFIFDNSTGYYNDVVDQTGNSTGLTDLADGECLYVDLDRTANLTGGDALVAAKAVMSTLGPGSVPGARNIIAWRVGAYVYTRNTRYPVGTLPFGIIPATTTANGILMLTRDYAGVVKAALSSLNNPVAVSDRGGIITTVAGTNHNGLIITTEGTGKGIAITSVNNYALDLTNQSTSPVIKALSTGGGFVLDGYNESGLATIKAINGDSGPGLAVTGGNAYNSDIATITNTSPNATYATLKIVGGASKGIEVTSDGAGASLVITAGPGHAIDVYGESGTAVINAVNGDNGAVMALLGSNSNNLPVVTITNDSGASSSTYSTLSIVANGSKGIDITTEGDGAGVKIVATDVGVGVDITTALGTSLAAYSESSDPTVTIENGDVGVALTVQTNNTNSIEATATGDGVPIVATSTNDTRIVQIAGPTPTRTDACVSALGMGNLTRAWFRCSDLTSGDLSDAQVFNVTGFSGDSDGLVTITFPVGAFSTAAYVPIITWHTLDIDTPIIGVQIMLKSTIGFPIPAQTTTQFCFRLCTGDAENSYDWTGTPTIGLNIVFIGCGEI